jgi:hypothetical protein
MEIYFENASCRAQPIDRETVLISLYAMTRKAVNDMSVIDFS